MADRDPGELGALVRRFLDRVVNARDLTAVADLVSPDYVGSGPGWPEDREQLLAFYEAQARLRPDWHIDVLETVEVGDWVAVRAHAGGHVGHDDLGQPLPRPARRDLEWLATYRLVGGRIAEVRLLVVAEPSR
jgi:predicted SnoaL-like aldol condensation-catalyzing enzyme